jgi:hypothetical protein
VCSGTCFHSMRMKSGLARSINTGSTSPTRGHFWSDVNGELCSITRGASPGAVTSPTMSQFATDEVVDGAVAFVMRYSAVTGSWMPIKKSRRAMTKHYDPTESAAKWGGRVTRLRAYGDL